MNILVLLTIIWKVITKYNYNSKYNIYHFHINYKNSKFENVFFSNRTKKWFFINKLKNNKKNEIYVLNIILEKKNYLLIFLFIFSS